MRIPKHFKKTNATKEDVIGLFDLCFKEKEKEFQLKYNNPFHLTIAIICGFLAVMIQFFPAMLLENWFGKFIGVGSLSAVMIMSLKGIMKTFLEKTTFITRFLNKILNNLKKVFKRNKKRSRNYGSSSEE